MAELEAAENSSCQVRVRRHGGVPVIALAGELDMTSADDVRSAVDDVLRHDPGQVVFDTSALQFMDSSGIALLLSVARRVPDVQLRRPSPIVRRLIELTGLEQTLRITG
jgi:anti-sigma B factor antagonist